MLQLVLDKLGLLGNRLCVREGQSPCIFSSFPLLPEVRGLWAIWQSYNSVWCCFCQPYHWAGTWEASKRVREHPGASSLAKHPAKTHDLIIKLLMEIKWCSLKASPFPDSLLHRLIAFILVLRPIKLFLREKKSHLFLSTEKELILKNNKVEGTATGLLYFQLSLRAYNKVW